MHSITDDGLLVCAWLKCVYDGFSSQY